MSDNEFNALTRWAGSTCSIVVEKLDVKRDVGAVCDHGLRGAGYAAYILRPKVISRKQGASEHATNMPEQDPSHSQACILILCPISLNSRGVG